MFGAFVRALDPPYSEIPVAEDGAIGKQARLPTHQNSLANYGSPSRTPQPRVLSLSAGPF